MKPGRNDPCPCGSGAKFKKCCVDTWEQAASASPSEGVGASADQIASKFSAGTSSGDRGLGLTPYVVAKIAEDPEVRRGLPARERARLEKSLRENWTLSKVVALPTEAITELLARFGVAWDEAAFVTAAGSRWSAWSFSYEWLERGATLRGKDQDFLGLAACELWKRLLPHRPSIEMLDDWMQEGYSLLDVNKTAEAVEVWSKLWSTLRERFTPSMRTTDATSEVFTGSQFLGNWCQDFDECLWNASRRDDRFLARGRLYCEQWLAQFVDENELEQVGFRRLLADFLFCEGEAERAEKLLLEVVERWPTNAWGYIALADAHGHLVPWSTLPKDVPQALAWIERGFVAIGPKGRDRDALVERLRELKAPALTVRP
jgi:hypothetical protein